MGSKVSLFGTAGQWTVYVGKATDSRHTVKRAAEKRVREIAAERKEASK